MDVACRQFHCCGHGRCVDHDIVELLQARSETYENLFRGIRCGFVDAEPVETPHQCPIFFKTFVIFFPGGGGHDLEHALGDGGFDHVGKV